MFNNDKTSTAMLNNHQFDQGDRGFDPIRLAQFLQTFLIASGFKATIKEMPSANRNVDGKEFPRRSVVVETTKKTQQDLLDKINNFNAMFNESDTYAIFETKLAGAKSKHASAFSPSASAPAFVPGAPVANKTEQVSFASAAAKIGSVSATVPTAASVVPKTETALQTVARLKKDQAALKKKEEELAQALSNAEATVNVENANSLESMIGFATSRGNEFLEELLKKLKDATPKVEVSAPAKVEVPAPADVPKSQTSWADEADGQDAELAKN